jgi:cell division initiation protein
VKITPLDIRRREFKRGMRGYADEEVDVFLDDVADEFERLFQENIELQDRMQRMDEQIAGHAQLKAALEKTLVSAQLQADQLIANARKEAELILRDAELKARDIVNGSYTETQKVQQTLIQLKHLEEDFRFKFRSLLEGHLKLLNDAPITPASAAAVAGAAAMAAPMEAPVADVEPAAESVEPVMTAELPAEDHLATEALAAEDTPEFVPVPAPLPIPEPPVWTPGAATAVFAPSAPAPASAEDTPTEETEVEEAAAVAEVHVREATADEPTAELTVETGEDTTRDEQDVSTQGFFFGKRMDEDEGFFASQPPTKDKSRDFEW